MSVEGALLGTPRVFNFEGKQYEVRLMGKSVKAGWERQVAAHEHECLQKSRHLYSASEYKDELRRLRERENQGEFSFANSGSRLASAWGEETLIKLLMPTCPQDVIDKLLDDHPEDVKFLIDRTFEESFPQSAAKAKGEANAFDDDPLAPSGPGSQPSS